MRYRHPPAVRRSGLAAVELALLLPLVLVLIFGIWDVGRLVEVQQLTSNAARGGARLASIGSMLDPTTGAENDITSADIEQAVVGYLQRNNIDTTGVTVQFSDIDNSGATDPYLAGHLDHLRVTVQLPFQNVRLILVNNFINVTSSNVTGTADWLSMKDVNVSVPTTLPTS